MQGVYRYLAQERVHFGKPAADAVVEEADLRGADKVLLVSGNTLTNKTQVVSTIAQALGSRHAGTFSGTQAHVPRATVISLIDEIRALPSGSEMSIDEVLTMWHSTFSMAGLITEPQLVIYAVTKSSVIKISEAIYLQLQQRQAKLGVSVLCPAFVTSDLGNAARNRPQELSNSVETQPESVQPSLLQNIQKGNWKTMSPEQCAELVFKSIREGTCECMG